jgi:hypothetical protein
VAERIKAIEVVDEDGDRMFIRPNTLGEPLRKVLRFEMEVSQDFACMDLNAREVSKLYTFLGKWLASDAS